MLGRGWRGPRAIDRFRLSDAVGGVPPDNAGRGGAIRPAHPRRLSSRLGPRNRPAAQRVSHAMTKTKQSQPKPKLPRGRRTGHPNDKKLNQATTEEFEQEGLGVAPKE